MPFTPFALPQVTTMQRESVNSREDLGGPPLPPLPSLVRYHDDFDDCYRSVGDLDASNHWVLTINGRREVLSFDQLSGWRHRFLKIVVVDLLARRSTSTAFTYASSLRALPVGLLASILDAIGGQRPQRFLDLWSDQFRSKLRPDQMRAVRYVAGMACRMGIGHWAESDSDLVRRLPGASIDKFARARSGKCFLPFKAQSEIVEHIDQAAARARTIGLGERDLIEICVLALSYQYGLRPGQIARIQREGVRRFQSGAVHISISLLKQRGEKRAREVVRPIQRDWCVLFERLPESAGRAQGKLLAMIPAQVSTLVRQLTQDITGTSYSCADLRHTAAQRLVDGGASRETVSDFLGHTDTSAVDVYYETSPQQAELVNAALGLSDIYRNVEKVARTGTIDPELLRSYSPDNQVSGIPHGVPISGVGLCRTGQSLCQRNPVVACYTCHRFLPVADLKTHEAVLSDMREAVTAFDQPSRVDRVSPAMLQLRYTLEAIQRLVTDLSSRGAANAV